MKECHVDRLFLCVENMNILTIYKEEAAEKEREKKNFAHTVIFLMHSYMDW